MCRETSSCVYSLKKVRKGGGGGDDKKPKTACFADTQGWQSLFFILPRESPNQRKSVGNESPNGAARGSFIYFLLGFSSPWSRIYSNTPAHNPATKSRPCIGAKSHYSTKDHNIDKQNDSYAPYYRHPPGTFLQAHPSYRIRKHGVHPSLISGSGGKRVLLVTFLHFILRF